MQFITVTLDSICVTSSLKNLKLRMFMNIFGAGQTKAAQGRQLFLDGFESCFDLRFMHIYAKRT